MNKIQSFILLFRLHLHSALNLLSLHKQRHTCLFVGRWHNLQRFIMAVKDKGLTPMMKQFFTFKHQHPDAIRLLQQKKLQLLKQQLKRLKKQQQNNCLLCKYDIRGKHEILFPSFFCPFVRLVNVGKADSSFVIFLFVYHNIPCILLLFQALISAVFYPFYVLLSYSF